MSRRIFCAAPARALAALVLMQLVAPAFADPTVLVRLTVNQITGMDDFEGDAPDFYAVMAIDGRVISTEDWDSQDDLEDRMEIRPSWSTDADIDLSRGTIPLRVEIREEDGAFRLADEFVDISPGASHALNLVLDLTTCSVSGDARGGAVFGVRTCQVQLTTSGTGSHAPIYAGRLDLQIDIENLPGDGLPRTGGPFVTCSHSAIWPQPGDTVTFSGATFTSDAPGRTPAMAESIRVVFDHADLTPRSCDGAFSCAEAKVTPVARSITYGCEARVAGQPLFSGWRTVSVGLPAAGRAVPLMVSEGRDNTIDIVFVPDRDDYTGPGDPNFVADVRGVIQRDYLGEDAFAINGHRFSFWLALDMGNASGGCTLDVPANWDDDYTFADSGALLHRMAFRDCARRSERIFSAQVTAGSTGRIAIHETAHSPFGLADEYCNNRVPPAGVSCDGGYFEADEEPNVYESADACNDDLPILQSWDSRLGDPIRTVCFTFIEPIPGLGPPLFGERFFTSEPPTGDLMVRVADPPRGADIRRFQGMFRHCGEGLCR
jgi:hypothetical protein